MLTAEILTNLPSDAEISRLAQDLADAILHLSAIRIAKRHLLASPEPADRLEHPQDQDDARLAHLRAPDPISKGGQALRRIAAYERKAISRRNGLIRRLDYLTLEMRRQHAG